MRLMTNEQFYALYPDFLLPIQQTFKGKGLALKITAETRGKWKNEVLYMIDLLFKKMEENGLDDKLSQAYFIAQSSHETSNFRKVEEDLSYSTARILEVYKSIFKDNPADAALYARNPEKLGNKVYANKFGNGDEASGDGYKYRGRGLLMTTFKYNYPNAYKDDPDSVTKNASDIISCGLEYWSQRNCSDLARAGDFIGVTRAITGGSFALHERKVQLSRLQRYL